jgi:uncharacterized membrane protein
MSLVNTLKDQNSRTRSLAKALTWRITATLTTAAIAYVVTGELKTAVMIGGIEFVLKFMTYYGHERVWNFVK